VRNKQSRTADKGLTSSLVSWYFLGDKAAGSVKLAIRRHTVPVAFCQHPEVVVPQRVIIKQRDTRIGNIPFLDNKLY
jgi:hypothetical protein